MRETPVMLAAIGTVLLLALIVIVEVREYAGRMRERRLDELHRRK